jgi:hypothetical protein
MDEDQEARYELIFTAFRYGALKNMAKTLNLIERSLRAQESNLALMAKTAPEFDFLREDPQFQRLLRAAGVPQ